MFKQYKVLIECKNATKKWRMISEELTLLHLLCPMFAIILCRDCENTIIESSDFLQLFLSLFPFNVSIPQLIRSEVFASSRDCPLEQTKPMHSVYYWPVHLMSAQTSSSQGLCLGCSATLCLESIAGNTLLQVRYRDTPEIKHKSLQQEI